MFANSPVLPHLQPLTTLLSYPCALFSVPPKFRKDLLHYLHFNTPWSEGRLEEGVRILPYTIKRGIVLIQGLFDKAVESLLTMRGN
jgi:hypothetical protein